VAQSGEWLLYEGLVTAANLGAVVTSHSNKPPQTTQVQLRFTDASQVWLDDVRMQPQDAQVTSYVYDPRTLKLLASFDDQHFGLFYQYDPEGRLVRKQVETERGRQTTQENLYNTPTVPKTTP
jgi:YD repeat-containing protein